MPNLLKYLTLRELERHHYQQLARQCHLSPDLPPTRSLHGLVPRPAFADRLPPLIAVTAYSTPLAHLAIRDRVTGDFFKQPATQRQKLILLNHNVTYASRLIVDNRFRRQGLGRHLLEQTLPLQQTPIVETLFPWDFRVDLLQSLDFTAHYNPPPPHYQRLREALTRCRINPALYHHPESVHRRIESLPLRRHTYCLNQLASFVARHRSKRHPTHSLERTAFVLSKLNYPTAYLIRMDPRSPVTAQISLLKTGDPHHTVPSPPKTPIS